MPTGRPLQAQQETFRLPLFTTPDYRDTTTSVIYKAPMSGMCTNVIPISHTDPVGGEKTYKLQVRPSMFTDTATLCNPSAYVNDVTQIGAKACCTFTSINNVSVVAYYDDSNSTHYILQYTDSAITKIGSIAGFDYDSEVFLTEVVIANVTTLALTISNPNTGASEGHYATSVANVFPAASLTKITDAQYPGMLPTQTVGPMLQMNGTCYVMGKNGNIYNSDLNSITSWNALGVLQAISYPDIGVGLCRYKHHIVAFGKDTIEFFNDVGLPPPGSPLKRTDQSFIKFGCSGSGHYINVADTLYWCATGTGNVRGLWRLEGYTPVQVSDETVTNLISAASNLYLQATTFHGAPQILLNAPVYSPLSTSDVSGNSFNTIQTSTDPYKMTNSQLSGGLALDVNTNTFWIFALSPTTTSFGIDRIVTCVHSNQPDSIHDQRKFWFRFNSSSIFSGSVMRMAPNSVDAGPYSYDQWQDYTGSVAYYKIPVIIFSPIYDLGNEHRKAIRKIKLIGDSFLKWSVSGSAPLLDWNTTTPEMHIYLMVNKGDIYPGSGSTNSIPYIVRDAVITPPAERVYWNNLGMSRKWQFVLAFNTHIPVRLEALELTVAQGTH